MKVPSSYLRGWLDQNAQINALIAICIIEYNNHLFVGERVSPPQHALEFPGGKVDPFNRQLKPKDKTVFHAALREKTEEVGDPQDPPVLDFLGCLGRGLPHYVFELQDGTSVQRVFRTINFLFRLKSGSFVCDPKVHHAVGWVPIPKLLEHYDLLAGSAKIGLQQTLRWFAQNEPRHSECDHFNRFQNISYPNIDHAEFKYDHAGEERKAIAELPILPGGKETIEVPHLTSDDTLRFHSLIDLHIGNGSRMISHPLNILRDQVRAKKEFHQTI